MRSQRAGAERSRLPSQTLDRTTDLADGVPKLDVQSVVAGAITDAFSNGKLEEAADAVEVGVNPRHLGKGEGIEADKVILVDAERNHSRFLLPWAAKFECRTAQ